METSYTYSTRSRYSTTYPIVQVARMAARGRYMHTSALSYLGESTSASGLAISHERARQPRTHASSYVQAT